MKDYKGFTGTERNAMDKKLKEAIQNGEFETKGVCVKCGQSEGLIDLHSHDYSHPTKYTEEWCYRCHMVHHMEYRNFEAAVLYWEKVFSGYKYPPMYKRNIGEISAMFKELKEEAK